MLLNLRWLGSLKNYEKPNCKKLRDANFVDNVQMKVVGHKLHFY